MISIRIKAKIDRMVSGDKVKAIASVSLDGQFVVKGLRVVDGNKGLFVAGPQTSFKDKGGNTQYKDLFFPISNAGRDSLQDTVLKAYSQALDQVQQQTHDSGFDSQDDGILPFNM